MKEELITFETAKLAKEKGFDIEVLNHYNHEYSYDKAEIFQDDVKNSELESYEYSAPTQALLQKWLREVHEINVIRVNFEIKSDIDMCTHKTYEQALEKGLIEALKLIE